MDDRFTRSDWLAHGLMTLSQKGSSALKAGKMARELGVSRGSFYWHFTDIDAFHVAVLEQWRDQATRQVIVSVDDRASASGRLAALMTQAFDADVRLERAIRAWSTESEKVAGSVAQVDQQRIAYLVTVLSDQGLHQEEAQRRARFIYWAYLGYIMAPELRTFTDVDIDRIVDLFLS